MNQTGLVNNYEGDPLFPVMIQITFNGDHALVVDPGPVTATVGSGLESRVADFISYDSNPFGLGTTMATLTGTVSRLGPITIDAGGGPELWSILTGIITESGTPERRSFDN